MRDFTNFGLLGIVNGQAFWSKVLSDHRINSQFVLRSSLRFTVAVVHRPGNTLINADTAQSVIKEANCGQCIAVLPSPSLDYLRLQDI